MQQHLNNMLATPNRVIGHMIGVLLFLASFYFADFGWAQVPKRTLEFSWDAVEKSKGYELQFTQKGVSQSPRTFQVESNSFKGELPVGSYNLRIRTLDARGVPGAWSSVIPVVLKLPKVEGLSPRADQEIRTDEDEEAKVLFRWKPVADGLQYTVSIFDLKGKKIVDETTDEVELTINLKVGKEYRWRVVAAIEDEGKGDEWDEMIQFVVMGKKLEKPEIQKEYDNKKPFIKWSKPAHVSAFKLQISRKDETSPPEASSRDLVKEDRFKKTGFKVPAEWTAGKYVLTVTALGRNRLDSDVMRYEFEVPEEETKVVRDKSTPSKGKPAGPTRPPHRFEVGYEYVPFLRTITIESTPATASFSAFVGSSHRLGGSYEFVSEWQRLLIHADYHVTRKNLFESSASSSEDASEQEPKNIDTGDAAVRLDYRLVFWSIGIGPSVDIQKRTLFLLTADDLTAFELDRSQTTELLLGGGIGIYSEGGTRSELVFQKGSLASKLEFQDFSRSVFGLRFGRPLGSDLLLLLAGYTFDTTSYSYRSSGDIVYATKWTNNMFNVGLALSF